MRDPPLRTTIRAEASLWRSPQVVNYSPKGRLSDLLDHLVGTQQCRCRHIDAERLGGLEIDDRREFRRPLDRKIGRISALENPVHKERRVAIGCDDTHAVAYRAAGQSDI